MTVPHGLIRGLALACFLCASAGCGQSNTDEEPTPSAFEGHTWDFDIKEGTWVDPPGIGDLVRGQLTGYTLLIHARYSRADEMAFDLSLGSVDVDVGEGTRQDPCVDVAHLPRGQLFPGDTYQLLAPRFILRVNEFPIMLYELELAGQFLYQGYEIVDGTFAAVVDTRHVEGMLGLSDGTLCQIAPEFNIPLSCDPCPDDGAPYCATLRVEDIPGFRLEGIEFDTEWVADPEQCDLGF